MLNTTAYFGNFASRGSRKFGEREKQIKASAALKQVRLQARRVIVKAFWVALPLTLIAYFLPFK